MSVMLWPVADTTLLAALNALGLKAPEIRARLGNRYSIHQVRRKVREVNLPPKVQLEKAMKQGWRYVLPEGPPELWKRLDAASETII